jgi:hypothetical protein
MASLDVDQFLRGDSVNKRPFRSNISITMFPRQRIRMQQYNYCSKGGVFYVVRAEMLYASNKISW